MNAPTRTGPDAFDSLPIAVLLQSRLASWFGDDRQSFLAADLVPVVAQIVSELQHSAVEMARKATIAEAERDDALAAAERHYAAFVGAEAELARLKTAVPDDGSCSGCGGKWVESMREGCNRPWHHADQWDDECDHHWLDRPESDTRECLVCGAEVAG